MEITNCDADLSAVSEHNEVIDCKVGGVLIKMVVDSGSIINTINEKTFNRLLDGGAKMFRLKGKNQRPYRAYASQNPLDIKKIFHAKIEINKDKPTSVVEFFVVNGARQCLMSKSTGEELKVLKVG
jgi:hypothetical protein